MKYETILNYIKRDICEGNIKPGDKLPSIRNICERFQCSKVTAVKVYDLLEKEHTVYSVPKSGHYLIENNINLNNSICKENIDFSTSAPDEEVLPYNEFQHCLNQAMDLYKESLLFHTNTQGLENLIKVLQRQLENYQVFAEKQCIFITSGAQQAINILTMMEFPNGKENVLIEQPTYYGIIESLKLNKRNVATIQRNQEKIDFYELEEIFKNGNIKFFYTIPRFHNPTGFSYTNDEKKQIVKLAEKYDVYIVEDDYLADLDINKKSEPIYALDINSRIIYLKSYSKILLPGLRVSAVVLPKALIKTFEQYKKWTDLNTSILSQGALEIYINSGMFDQHMNRLRRVYSDRMSCLNEIIKSYKNSSIEWHVPSSGYFASFKIKDVNTNNLVKRLKMKNVLLQDPDLFYVNNKIKDKIVRLSVSRANSNEIKEGLAVTMEELVSC